MVHMPRLISRSTSSISGSSLLTWMCLNIWSATPSFFASLYMMTWSGSDSNSGSMTWERHWKERFDAVTEP